MDKNYISKYNILNDNEYRSYLLNIIKYFHNNYKDKKIKKFIFLKDISNNSKIFKILWGDKYAMMKIYRLDNNTIDYQNEIWII